MMFEAIARARVSSSRGRSRPREVKKRPKCRFPIRKRNRPAAAVKLAMQIIIVNRDDCHAN
jgi:hypothetical protein